MSDQTSTPKSRRQFLQSVGATGGMMMIGGMLPLHRALAAGGPPAINLGQVLPMTGSAAEFGPYYRDAVRLAVDQINTAAKEVFGGPIIANHVTADSATLPTVGVQAARQMVDTQHTPIIINGWSSGVTVAIATSVTIPSGVLQIGNGTTSPLVSVLPADAKADLLFRTSASDAMQGVVAAQFVNGEIDPNYKFKKVATIYINNPYGQGLSNAFAAAFEKRGGKMLAEVAHPEEAQPTYRAQITAALKDNPDVLLLPTYPSHTAQILKECRDIFGYTSWQFTDANRSKDVLDAVGGADLAGKLGTVPSADPESPSYKTFAEAYRTATDQDRIPPFTETTYDAAMVIGLALAKLVADGTTDASKVTGRALADQLRPIANPPGESIVGGSQDAITKALQLLKEGTDINYVGAGGSVDFDDNGDVKTPVAIWQFTEDGDENIKIVPADEIASE
jgi:ABC-type branched-subunit amino acid transport system substrate-binding protein